MLTVVMSVYIKDEPLFFEESLQSILTQTMLPAQLVIVCDGELSGALNGVLENFCKLANFDVDIVRLPENVGRGPARNAGVKSARNSLVAIMDSDDVMHPDRLYKQFNFLENNPQCDLVACLSKEFTFNIEETGYIKYCPPNHAEIIRDLQFSCCLCNPSICFRIEKFWLVGGYPEFRDVNEDYLLFFRLLKAGAIFHCIQEVLLFVRIGLNQKARRRGIKLFRQDVRFRVHCINEQHQGLISAGVALVAIAVRRLLPSFISDSLHKFWRIYRSRDLRTLIE